MSTIKNPVGPQPSKVYWRRRVLVLLGVVAVIAIIVLIIVRPGSSSGTAADESTGVAGTSSATAAPSPGAIDSAPVGDGDAPACDAAAITVVPVLDMTSYSAGQIPQLSVSITNTGSVACSLNVGTTEQVYTITSGAEQYWISTDCQSDPTDAQTVIEPGSTLSSTPFPWDRTRSAADTCASPDRPEVPAGGASYHLSVSIGGFTSAQSTQFILS